MHDLLVEKMYMFVCKYLDPSQTSEDTQVDAYDEADAWIDVWVGCANVAVHRGFRVSNLTVFKTLLRLTSA
jgi:hypothetical protein